MERLTSSGWPNGNKFLFANVHPKRKDMQPALQKTVNRLGAYEDLNRTPAELAADLAELAEYRRQIEAGERDGRCVVLPCKVGDTVYKLWYEPCHHGETYPDGMGCCGCEDACDLKRAVIPFTANSIEHIVGMMKSLGSFWFLTREAAEAALIAQEGKHDSLRR